MEDIARVDGKTRLTTIGGHQEDYDLLVTFLLNSSEVKACFPPGRSVPQNYCRCFPSINVKGSAQPFADRLVFIGDRGESRLYKDGIGLPAVHSQAS